MCRNLKASRFKRLSWHIFAMSALLLFTFAPLVMVQARDDSVETAARAVVRVLPQRCAASICNDAGVGSGVIIEPSGVILTAWHVTTLVQAKDPTVTPHTYADDFIIEMTESLVTKPVARYRAKLIATREKSDLALLRIYATDTQEAVNDLHDLPTLPISTEEPRTERLRLMGFPPAGGGPISYPAFEQSGFDADDGGELLKVQGQLSRGFSGGPALVERNGHYEIVGIVIKARGEGAEVGLLRGIGELQQLDWQMGAQQVWADTVQVGTHTTNGEAMLYISANLHMLDFVGRSAQLVAFAFDANKKPFTPTKSSLPQTQKGQLALPRNFTAQHFVDRLDTFMLSVRVKELGAPVEQLRFRILLLDTQSKQTLWDSNQLLAPQLLAKPPEPKPKPPSVTSQPAVSSTAPPDLTATETAIAGQVATAVATQLAALATPMPSSTSTPDTAMQKTEEARRVATGVAIALATLPTATPSATPTPDLRATETAAAGAIATTIAATLTAQPTATPNATETAIAKANAVQTAVVLTLTAYPTAFQHPATATSTPIVDADCVTPIYLDDFSNDETGWTKSWFNKITGSSNGYRDNAYYFRVLVPDAPMWEILGREFDFNNATIYLDATVLQGRGKFGLLLDFSGNPEKFDQGKYYLADLTTEGKPSLSYREANITHRLEANASELRSFTPKIGEPYQLIIKESDSELKIIVDDQEVVRVPIGSIGKGQLGLFMAGALASTPFEVVFDNLRICK